MNRIISSSLSSEIRAVYCGRQVPTGWSNMLRLQVTSITLQIWTAVLSPNVGTYIKNLLRHVEECCNCNFLDLKTQNLTIISMLLSYKG